MKVGNTLLSRKSIVAPCNDEERLIGMDDQTINSSIATIRASNVSPEREKEVSFVLRSLMDVYSKYHSTNIVSRSF